MSLIKYYCMLQNARVTAFTVSELLRENQHGHKIIPPTPCTPRLVLKQKLRKQHYHLTELIIIMCLKVFLMKDLLLYKTSLKKTAWQFRNLTMVTLWDLLTGKITWRKWRKRESKTDKR